MKYFSFSCFISLFTLIYLFIYSFSFDYSLVYVVYHMNVWLSGLFVCFSCMYRSSLQIESARSFAFSGSKIELSPYFPCSSFSSMYFVTDLVSEYSTLDLQLRNYGMAEHRWTLLFRTIEVHEHLCMRAYVWLVYAYLHTHHLVVHPFTRSLAMD